DHCSFSARSTSFGQILRALARWSLLSSASSSSSVGFIGVLQGGIFAGDARGCPRNDDLGSGRPEGRPRLHHLRGFSWPKRTAPGRRACGPKTAPRPSWGPPGRAPPPPPSALCFF